MQVVNRWPELEAKRQRAANLSFREALAITAEPKAKAEKFGTIDDYLENVDEDLLAEIPELSPDKMLVALIDDGLLEVWPSHEHPGYYYLLIYENLSTDASDVVYDKRPCRYSREILAHALVNVHKVKPWAWGTEPARNEIPLPVQKDRDPSYPPAARAYPAPLATMEGHD